MLAPSSVVASQWDVENRVTSGRVREGSPGIASLRGRTGDAATPVESREATVLEALGQLSHPAFTL